ncbi:hypothetical protein LCL61_33150 [Amycolatopsis coloradensis]|uniref:Uncharacterized protein n=1 Tax=Amycolatopsis coloradensis TaxID=76021 RepID=A0ACD5BMF8_9PSEU
MTFGELTDMLAAVDPSRLARADPIDLLEAPWALMVAALRRDRRDVFLLADALRRLQQAIRDGEQVPSVRHADPRHRPEDGHRSCTTRRRSKRHATSWRIRRQGLKPARSSDD